LSDPDLVSSQMIEGVLRFKRIEGAKEALRAIADRNLPAGGQAASFRDLVQENRVPVMIMWGERDAILNPAAAQGLPSSVEVVLVENAGQCRTWKRQARSTVSSPSFSRPPIADRRPAVRGPQLGSGHGQLHARSATIAPRLPGESGARVRRPRARGP
jgi:hypothetical protein